VNSIGKNGLLTPLQKVEAVAWYKAKRQLGTFKSKAREMRVPSYALEHHISWLRRKGEL
jgi:hypothetical protein